MDTLDGTAWDVVIAGTGIQPALLALALSRSGKKILHVDGNDYYGGAQAALSISEAQTWAHRVNIEGARSAFKNASIHTPSVDGDGRRLGHSRAYSLSLSPCLLYTRSAMLSALVTSKAHQQLEFLAVGSWFVFQSISPESAAAPFQPASKLLRVPNSREDIFSDTSLSIRAKGALVKFLRFVSVHQNEDKRELWEPYAATPFVDFLVEEFKIQPEFHGPLLALCMSTEPSREVTTKYALDNIFRHLSSMGVFGAGFSAVLTKFGGISEIVQVACRAAAVGGALYALNRSITAVDNTSSQADGAESHKNLQLQLQEGDAVTTSFVFGTPDQLPAHPSGPPVLSTTSRSITIVASNMPELFPSSAEGSPPPSVAVIVFTPQSLRLDAGGTNEFPVHALVHSSDTGECPPGQCVIYTSTMACTLASSLLQVAVHRLLSCIDEQPAPAILWTMQYDVQTSAKRPILYPDPATPGIHYFLPGPASPVFDDLVLESVKDAWKTVTGGADDDFLKFGDRGTEVNEVST